MQHRAHVRKRVVPVEARRHRWHRRRRHWPAPPRSASVGSVAGRQALALLRLDRAAEAKAKGEP